MNAVPTGMLLGLVGGAGLLLAVANVPPLQRPRLDDRLAPYLRESPRPSRLLGAPRTVTPFVPLERLLRPILDDATTLLERYVGGSASVAGGWLGSVGGRRSRRSGSSR